MQVIYIGGHDAVEVPGAGVAERDGEPVEVADDVGAELVKRGDFKKAGARKRGEE